MPDKGDWYAENLDELRSKAHCSEDDVSRGLVRPCLERILGYGLGRVDGQRQIGRHRPDFICTGSDGWARVIVEVKNLDISLVKRPRSDSPWEETPAGQLDKYLRRYELSKDGTWGLVTNGEDWIVCQRNGPDVKWADSARVLDLDGARRLLKRVPTFRAGPGPKAAGPVAGSWLAHLQEGGEVSARNLVRKLAPAAERPVDVGRTSAIAGVRSLSPEFGQALFEGEVWVACLDLNLPDGYVAPADISERLRRIATKEAAGPLHRVSGLARWRQNDGRGRCRGFFWQRGDLVTTAALDPHFPGHRGAQQILRLEQSGTLADTTPADLWGDDLRKEFYELVAEWFGRTSRSAHDLRHLIRILFVWLLQERGLLPDSVLWEPDPAGHPGGFDIHRHIEWLFTRVLAVPPKGRRLGESATERQEWLAKAAPFLNGSLFTPHTPGEELGDLPNRMYEATGEQPGLFVILRRYDWTLSEQSGYEKESALDPSMLGTLFERLILTVEGAHVTPSGDTKGNY